MRSTSNTKPSDFLRQLGIENNKSLQGTVTAIYDIGCFFGAIAAYFLGGMRYRTVCSGMQRLTVTDILGRKNTILLGTTIMSIGALLQITAFGVPHMIVGRTLPIIH